MLSQFENQHCFTTDRLEHTVGQKKKKCSRTQIVQVLPHKIMREACNIHHRYASTMRDKTRKNKQTNKKQENPIVCFLNNLLAMHSMSLK